MTYAFRRYPLFIHLIPAKFDIDQKLRILLRFMIRFGISYGEVYATSPNMEGVAVWFPSDKAEISIWKMVRIGGLSLIYDFLKSERDLVPKLLSYNKYTYHVFLRLIKREAKVIIPILYLFPTFLRKHL